MSAALYIEKEEERRKGRKTKRAKEENNTIDSASTEQQEEDDRPNDAANLTGYGLLRSSSSGDGHECARNAATWLARAVEMTIASMATSSAENGH